MFVGAWLSSECVPGPSCEYQVGHIAALLSVSSRLFFLMSVSLACMRLSVPVSPLVFVSHLSLWLPLISTSLTVLFSLYFCVP